MAKQKVSAAEIYKLSRYTLGREPDASDNRYNYLQLAKQGASRQEILNKMREDTPVPFEQHQKFLKGLGIEMTPAELTQEQMSNLMVSAMADVIDTYIQEEEKKLADIGVFDPDGKIEAQIRESVMEDEGIKKYMEEQYSIMDRKIKEGRIGTMEDFHNAMQLISDTVTGELEKLSITETETQEELKNKLADIGATTRYNLDQARKQWVQRARQEAQIQLQAGRGFSGVMKEQMGELVEQAKSEAGEIARQGAVAEQSAQRAAKYTLERTKAAREAIAAYKKRQTSIARQGLMAGYRKYGLSSDQAREVGLEPSTGYFEQEERARLKRLGEDIRAREIEQRLRLQRQEFQKLRGKTAYL